MKPVFLTGNKNKLAEAREILPFAFDNKNLDLDEIQSIDGRKVIEHKLEEAYKKLKQPVFVEDTALHFDGMNGFPGALIKFLLDSISNEGICKIVNSLGNNKAEAVTYLGYFDGKKKKYFEGRVKGEIPQNPRKGKGFGWDHIFIPEGHKQAFSEMSSAEKNKISMRKTALRKFAKYIR